MKKIITVLSIITFSLISCKNEAESTVPKVVVPFYQVANQQQNQGLTTQQPNQNTLYPAPSAQNATTQTQAAPVAVAKGMNPSHGQPGHRCDIPVGAPLNNATATTNATNSSVASNTTITVPTPNTTVKTPKGMNPPHGQPGHRCDISVGAPLNSKPATTTPAPQAPAPAGGTLNYNVTVPPAPEASTQTPATPTPEGMNPPHGQNGHRCDVAVGAPLPKE